MLLNTLAFITGHPLTRERPIAAIARFARWQIQSRIRRDVEFTWIGGSKLIVRNGMTGATGNIYCGLHEFVDMAFVLHLLRPDDLFVDVGANIGSYTVLASAVAGAKTIAVEPDPTTMAALSKNIAANAIDDRVSTLEAALGADSGVARFTVGLDTINRIAGPDDEQVQTVRQMRLDDVVGDLEPVLIKLDVEGYEGEVLSGARLTLAKSSLLAIETETATVEVDDQLLAAGFEKAFYDPFARRLNDHPRWNQNNALYVRGVAACSARLESARPFSIFGHTI